jgi:hypothetical protein
MKPLIVAALFAAVVTPAGAQSLNKCTDARGKIVYQDAPCAGSGSTVKNWDRPTREQELEAENRALREQLNRRQAQESYQPSPRAPGRTRADLRAEQSNSQACRDATRSFENASFSQSRTYSSMQTARRAMEAACGMGF